MYSSRHLDISITLITSDPVSSEGKDSEPIHLHTTIKEPVLFRINWWTTFSKCIAILYSIIKEDKF